MPSIESHDDGLRRTFRVVIPSADLKAEVDAKIAETAPRKAPIMMRLPPYGESRRAPHGRSRPRGRPRNRA
jgi:hypothetical protein